MTMKTPDTQPATPLAEVPAREGWETQKSSWPTIDFDGTQTLDATSSKHQEWCMLTNRPFEVLDEVVHYKFLALILKKIKENPERKIQIVDLGGGHSSTAARGILTHPHLKGKIQVTNLDLFAKQIPPEELKAEGIDPEDLTILNEDFAEHSLSDNSIDVIISFQCLCYLNDERFQTALVRMAKMLTPGGEALLDEEGPVQRLPYLRIPGHPYFPPFNMDPDFWYNHIMTKGVYTSSTTRERNIDGSSHIMGSSPRMLQMVKAHSDRRIPNPNDFHLAFPEIQKAVKAYK